MNIIREIKKLPWRIRKWRMSRARDRKHAEIIREIDQARAQHRSTHRLHRQLQAHVHKEMQS